MEIRQGGIPKGFVTDRTFDALLRPYVRMARRETKCGQDGVTARVSRTYLGLDVSRTRDPKRRRLLVLVLRTRRRHAGSRTGPSVGRGNGLALMFEQVVHRRLKSPSLRRPESP